ncbi:unnamed protein product [Prorocentrum cordatum]|uniref:Fibronectin type-III domain-containing protein n=1 Tax=Prorocentrum cordatum TaxID=2364126 RepID=A0ABN9V0U1_9DINO|nr:unnamed protein product [Polarella glacialis]
MGGPGVFRPYHALLRPGLHVRQHGPPFEVPVGGEQGGASSPQMRRPGFARGTFALTQQRVRGLLPATCYHFQVQAFNQVAASEWSEVSGPMRTLSSPPARCGPPKLVSGSLSDGMRLRWRAPGGPGEPPSRYDLCVADDALMSRNAREIRNVAFSPAPPPACDDDVEATAEGEFHPGSRYFVRARAANSAGPGEWSATSEALQVRPERPLRPEAPGALEPLPGGVLVRWAEPGCQGSAITSYRLRYSTSRTMTAPCEATNMKGAVTEFAVSPLKPNETYFFQVCAVNAVGESEWSAPSSGVATVVSPPAQMGAPHLLARSATSITLGFVPPADMGARNCNLVQTYTVRYLEEGPIEGTRRPPPASEGDPRLAQPAGELRDARPEGAEVSGLLPGSRYAFWVAGANASGEGRPSDLGHFSTLPSVPDRPCAPELVEEDTSSWSLTLRLAPAAGNGLAVTHYALEVEDTLHGEKWETETWEADPSQEDGLLYHTVLRLTPGIGYTVRAVAINELGRSEWSDPLVGCRCTPRLPEPPRLELHGSQPDALDLTWATPHHNGADITEYTLQWSTDDEFKTGKIEQLTTSELKATVLGLVPGMKYYARAASSNSEGIGRFGPVIAAVTGADTPQEVRQVQCKSPGHIHARVDWLIPFSSGSEIQQFRLFYRETDTDGRPEGERDSGELIVKGKKRSTIVEPLLAGREYTFEVQAMNSVGWGPVGPRSSPYRLLPALLPTPPGEPKLVSAGTESVRLCWDASDSVGAEVVEQVVQISYDPAFPDGNFLESLQPPWSQSIAVEYPPSGGGMAVVQQHAPSHGLPPAQGGDAADQSGDARWPHGCGPLGTSESRLETRWQRKPGVFKWAEYVIPGLRPGTVYHFRVASRNREGQGQFGPVSAAISTASSEPDAPEDLTSLHTSSFGISLGWRRGDCRGAPVTHYIVRYADAEEVLSTENCRTIQRVELARETWSGISQPEPLPPRPPEDLELDAACATEGSRDAILSRFTEHVLARFSTLELAWRALDPYGSGSVRAAAARGPRGYGVGELFPDLEDSFLDAVWANLGELGAVSPQHFGALQRYADRLLTTSLGPPALFEGAPSHGGPWCMIQDLQPGAAYFMHVCAVNAMGRSSWSPASPLRLVTPPAVPCRMAPLKGVASKRAPDSVTLQWSLPSSHGSPVDCVQIRWFCQDVGVPLPSIEEMLARGTDGTVAEQSIQSPWPGTEPPPTELTFSGLRPGQLLIASARASNSCGSCRAWSALTKPDDNGELWEHHAATAPLPPETPGIPSFVEGSLRSAGFLTEGRLRVRVARNNGPPLSKLGFELIDCLGIPSSVSHNLYVTIFTARGVVPAGVSALDLFCTANVPGRDETLALTTRTAFHTAAPEWRHREQLRDWRFGMPVQIQVWSREIGESPALLGQVCLEQAQFQEGFEGEVQLQGAPRPGGGEAFAHVKLEIEAFAAPRATASAWETEVGEGQGFSALIGDQDLTRGVPGLKPGRYYQLRARALSVEGASPWSELSEPVKTPPDVPSPPGQLQCEFTTMASVELRWQPPADNGDPDLSYEIATAPSEDTPEGEWSRIGLEAIARGLQKARRGFLLYKVEGLKPGAPMYFKHRARNCIGWSAWSEPSRFMTRATRPGKLAAGGLRLVDETPTTLRISWQEPPTNGSAVARYDIVGGPSLRVLRWAMLCTNLLERSPAADKLFNVDECSGHDYGEIVGTEEFSSFYCSTCMFVSLRGEERSLELTDLLPGQTYYFTMRGVCPQGKGDFSEVSSVKMMPRVPVAGDAPQIGQVTTTEAELILWLPYGNGVPIDSICVECSRTSGALSEEQVDPETGEPLEEFALMRIVQSPREFERLSRVGPETEELEGRRGYRGWIWGMTQGLLGAYRDEGVDEEVCFEDGHAPEIAAATSCVYRATVRGLLPGTAYTARWSSHNSCGWSEHTECACFTTAGTAPDAPPGVML